MGKKQTPQKRRHPTDDPAEARGQHIDPINHDFQTLVACCKHHSELLKLLSYRQPADVGELLSVLGCSRNRLTRQLRVLKKYNLIKQVPFEHHNLYCVNGDYNIFIKTILDP